ncbi:MAG: hypothetical protein MUF10_06760 [Thermoanaerobaculaceae bacterium]|nr:hypothetical protein [Thermoanaerobaculaceae bacterium]
MDVTVAAGLAVYAVALVALAWRSRTREQLEYLAAGRRLTLLPFVATLVSTWYGGVLGVGEYSFRYGISNWLVFGLPYYVAALLFAFVLASRARRSAALSIPEQLRSAYGPAAARIGAGLVLLLAIPAAYALMLGDLVRIYLDMPLGWAIACGLVFTMACAAAGGFRTVIASNTLQFALMYLAFMVLLPVALVRVGGFGALWEGVPATHRLWDGGLGVQAVLVWYFIALQTLVEPTFYQRCYAAQTPATARRGVLVSVGLWVVFDFLTTFSGMAARVLLPASTDPVLAYPALGRLILPPLANALFAVGLFATVMSTLHSYLFLAAATIGHDLAPELARRVDERRWILAGLVLTGGAAAALALALRSVVAIWHDVGSIVTAALLLPVATAQAPPRWRFGGRGAAVALVLAGLTATAWIAMRRPDGSYLLGLEPIFPALALSGLCWVVFRPRAT